ncbi:translation initiation factor IF-3 [Candidatus Poribacteria bacterium]|nr:translation initiation factor IF-3 [Candidatus Poribacteria bacterium]
MNTRQSRRTFGQAADRTRVNDQVRARQVRLIDENGEQLGIMSSEDAYRIAQERELDLVEVAPDGRPPVCRVMNYSKFRYEQAKRARAARKNQKVIEIKEIRLYPAMADHDVEYRLRHAEEFLKEGAKVRATIRFRGRQVVHSELGEDLLRRFAEELKELSVVEQAPRLEGRSMALLLAPRGDAAANT